MSAASISLKRFEKSGKMEMQSWTCASSGSPFFSTSPSISTTSSPAHLSSPDDTYIPSNTP